MNRLKAILAALAVLAATSAGLDLTGIVSVLPPDVARVLVVIPSAAAVMVHLITATNLQIAKIKEGADRTMPSLIVIISLGVVLFSITSCVTTTDRDGSTG